MRLNSPLAGAAKAFRPSLFVMLVCCACAGCGDYCLIINSNPGGTVNTNLSCPMAKPTGNVALTLGSSFTPFESAPLRTHLFVTLRGIDALAKPMAADDPPGWQELAPQLADQPVQVDLTAPLARSCESGPLGSAAVPAGVYHELRLRLVPNPSPVRAETSPPVDELACGTNVFNCLIPPHTMAQPLTWDDPAEVVIASDRIQDGFFRVLPDTSVHVSIALDPRSSLALGADHALRLIPSFSASVQSECSAND